MALRTDTSMLDWTLRLTLRLTEPSVFFMLGEKSFVVSNLSRTLGILLTGSVSDLISDGSVASTNCSGASGIFAGWSLLSP